MRKKLKVVFLVILVIILLLFFIIDMIYTFKSINQENISKEKLENKEETNISYETTEYLESIENLFDIWNVKIEDNENLITITTLINVDSSVKKLSKDNVLELQDSIKDEVLASYKLFEGGIYKFENTEIKKIVVNENKSYLLSGSINEKPFLSLFSETIVENVFGNNRTANLIYISSNGDISEINKVKDFLENIEETDTLEDVIEKIYESEKIDEK